MKNEKNKSLIIYELNEIPKKVLENFIYKYPGSNLAKLVLRMDMQKHSQ